MKYSLILTAMALVAMSTASCSVISGTRGHNTISGSAATQVNTTPTPATEPVQTPVTGSNPGPALPPSQQAQAPAPTSSSPLATQLAGEWSIIQAGPETIDRDEDMPYITFVPADGRFYANDGCNTINGSYRVNGKDEIEFYGLLKTMKYCPDVAYEGYIDAVVTENRPARLTLAAIGAETFVSFYDAQGREVMKMRRGDLAFLNGNWEVTSIAGLEEMAAPADVFFDLTERKIHGNTGCNFFNGEIYLDHRASNAVDFSNMGLTRMACPDATQETAMMVALEQTASAIQGDPDQVMLLDSQGRELMTLRRAPVTVE